MDLKINHEVFPNDIFRTFKDKEYISIAQKDLTILIQFSTLYLCELVFSSFMNNKCKIEKKQTTFMY